MNMHEHDIDLIMALAEGTLDAQQAAAAEAALAACTQCTTDLAAQRLALDALAGGASRFDERLRTGASSPRCSW